MTDITEHASREAMAQALAGQVAADLRAALSARGAASLAVPGGSTPRAFLTALGREMLDWERVSVTLTDERWVPTSSDRSNQHLLGQTLFRGAAAAARFVPLYGATPDPADHMAALELSLAPLLPLDVVVLGMGDDMHTASLFPGADRLRDALLGEALALPIRAPGAQEPRVTLTARVIAGARQRHLLIAGADKKAALEKARAASGAAEAPVRVALDSAPVEVHYAD